MPLAATWLMMSVEGPYLSAIIARLPEPKFNLAAYGVAFAVALIIESPVIMMMSASTALVKDKKTYLKLRNFSNILNLTVTIGMLIILINPIYDFFALTLLNLNEKVADLTYKAIALLLPWPGAIGLRRFYQGILIASGLTKRVAYGTIIRLFTMTVTAFILFTFTNYDGVIVGAAALSTGVIAEAIASRFMVHSSLKKLVDLESIEPLSYRGIYKFYYPLIMTSFLSLGVHPIVTFFMGHARMSLESLAVLPVINALVFIFRSIGLSYQEVIIALMGENFKNFKPLLGFAYKLGALVFIVLGLIAFTPLYKIWFHNISGLSVELTEFAHPALMIMSILPVLTIIISFQRSALVVAKHTQPITWATASEVAGIVLVMFVLISFFDFIGIVAAAAGYLVGRLAANIYLIKPTIDSRKRSEHQK